MLTSSLALIYDNTAHGEDTYLTRDLGNGNFLDAVFDGVTGHGGDEASGSVADALKELDITGPDDVVAALTEQNAEFHQVGGGRFLAHHRLHCAVPGRHTAHRVRGRQPYLRHPP